MSGKKGDGLSSVERACALLQYLKWNTDVHNKTSQKELRKVPELDKYMGCKDTFHDTIVNLAFALNSTDSHVRSEVADWEIIFEDFQNMYGETNISTLDERKRKDSASDNTPTERDEGTEEPEIPEKPNTLKPANAKSMQIRNLYYQHPFTYEEISQLIEAVRFSATLDMESVQRLTGKIEDKLTSVYYNRAPKNICRVYEPRLYDNSMLFENLKIIQAAIDDNYQISFSFNGYGKERRLEKISPNNCVSPYYIVANGGRYYLIASTEKHKHMSIWRIDLMTEVEELGIIRLPTRQVAGLPQKWDESFHLSHLNMSYDEPKNITLKISRLHPNQEKSVPDFTFLYDSFGGNFHVQKSSSEDFDFINVRCSPFAMVNWALQYSDRVEVLEPSHVRDMVKAKLQKLNEKYDDTKASV